MDRTLAWNQKSITLSSICCLDKAFGFAMKIDGIKTNQRLITDVKVIFTIPKMSIT